MRRFVGLQSELIMTTALLVGAALLFGGFLLLQLTEQKLIEQQVNHVRNMTPLIGHAISTESLFNSSERESDTFASLVSKLDLGLEEWGQFDRMMQPINQTDHKKSDGGYANLLVQQARLSTEPQLQIDPPGFWLPFTEVSAGSIDAAIALHDVSQSFSGVVWLRFSLKNVQEQIASTRRLVFIYVLLYGLVLTVFGVVVLSRNVVRPVSRLKEATALVATGDLTTHVEVDGPREIHELGQSFNRMTDALRSGRDELLRSERMASVGHLSAGMAHEIGNPLAAIIGYLEMLKVDVGEGAQGDLVRRSLDETARIDRLIRDLLDYAAPSGVVADPVDVCEVLTSTTQSLQSQTAFDGYTIVTECPEPLPAVCINPHKLAQVLINLISNARDASEPGSMIKVSACRDKDEVIVSVRDQGEGIDAEVLKQIFDPFFSTKPEGEGRGLGLTISHRIVAEAGGKIETLSDDSGTVFSVRLPINDGARV